jgi:DNA mismatch repair ATPase MutS
MEIDNTTLRDLNIFGNEEQNNVFEKINYTRTSNGEEQLRLNLSNPLNTVSSIQSVQDILKLILEKESAWPLRISNGTILMTEKFYETPLTAIPSQVSFQHAFFYKLLNSSDFSLIKFSVNHCFDFIKGMKEISNLLKNESIPETLNSKIEEIYTLIDKTELSLIFENESAKELDNVRLLKLAHFLRYRFKEPMKKLLRIHSELDAWFGMAMAVKNLKLHFPDFIETNKPILHTGGLYHLLLEQPVPYNLEMDDKHHFVFLTGANMAGKSTFIKAVGIALFLAHTGMGVPCTQMRLSKMDGLLSNINIMDNITKGESYFYNEVQRIKSTVNRINDGRKWLILIDELFKGTNVEDAMKCSNIVIEGLLKIPNSLFILSTHLYEIGSSLKKYDNILFRYFETQVINDEFSFSYQLKEGISNDRLGYLILKKEGVVKLLEKL